MVYKITFTLIFLCVIKHAVAQDVQVIKYSDLKAMENRLDDTTYVINFWATWCQPCVRELPYFNTLSETVRDQKVKVILVSLDFVSQLNSRLIPFVQKNKITAGVFLLDEPDYNSWIPKIDKSWSGAIPATLIVNNKNGVRKFYEQEFSEEELNKTVKSLIY